MALDRGYVDVVMERLEPLGAVTGKAMFGGYGIWEDGDMFALVDSGSTNRSSSFSTSAGTDQ